MKGRFFYPGGFYHVFTRGNNRLPIFFEQSDWQRCFAKVKHFSRKYEIKVISYVFIPNHIHFSVYQRLDVPVFRFMQALMISHVRYINAKYDRVGHLFNAPFKMVEIEKNEQLVEVTRYHHNNPVEAGLVKNPADWEWSSYRTYIEGIDDGVTNTRWVLGEKPNKARREEYRRFVEKSK